MKQCPACQSRYTDDTLQFCLQDGSRLEFVSDTQGKTLAFGEQETVVSNRPSNQINTPAATNPTDWNPQAYQSNAAHQTPEKKSNATAAVFLTAFVMLLLFSFVGIGAWLYFRGVTSDSNTNILLAKRNKERESSDSESSAPVNASRPMPMATPNAATSSNKAVNANSATVDGEQISRDVAARVVSWKSAAEARNLDNYMSNYAPTVDYYSKKGASLSTVRADKQKAFTTYDSIKITLGNIVVKPAASGETATAVFDKEWIFSGAKYSAGKVQNELKLKKINNQWLIAGEKDLKVYYTR